MSRRKQAKPRALKDGTDIEDNPSCSWPVTSPSSKDQTSPCHADDYEDVKDDGDADLLNACQFCAKFFSRLSFLKHHEQSHRDKLSLTCIFCSRMFKHKHSCDQHMKLHTGDKRYHCGNCDSAFSCSDHLKIHMKTHTTSNPHKCPVCHRGFLSTNSLHGHMQVHECGSDRGSARPSKECKLQETRKCNRCEEGFDMPDELQKHIAESHPECSPAVKGSEEAGLQCIYCHKQFSDEGKLLSHIHQVHGRDRKSNTCNVCSKHFPTMEKLYTHMDVHQLPESSNSPSLLPIGYTSVSSTTPDSNFSVDSLTLVYTASTVPKTHGRRKRGTQNVSDIHGRRAKHSKIAYSCIYCNKQNFSGLAALQSHLKTKHADKPEQVYTCQFCLDILPSLFNLNEHLKQVHNGEDPSDILANLSDALLQCNFCPEMLVDLNSLQEHIRCSHAFPSPVAKESNAFFCPVCFMGFLTETTLEEHVRQTHCNSGNLQMSPIPATPNNPVVKIYSCFYCTNSPIFNSVLKLNSHIKENHKNIPLALNYINRKRPLRVLSPLSPMYGEQTSLLKQNSTSLRSATEIICNQCGAKYTSLDLFQTHLKTHFNGVLPQLHCPQCSKVFLNQETLLKHVTAHFTITSTYYICESCDKQFTSVNDLQNHLFDMHTFVFFRCTLCQEVFDSKVSTQLHLAVKHSNEKKVYLCTSCNWDFRHEADLQMHVKHSHLENQGRSHRCIFCGESFGTEVELQCHITTHTKKYSCHFCSKAFNAVHLLERHIREKHCMFEIKAQNCSTNGSMSGGVDSVAKDDAGYQGFLTNSHVSAGESQNSHDGSEEDFDTSEVMYSCDICGASYTMESLLINHQLRDHNIHPAESAVHKRRADMIKGSFKCNVCSRTFFSEGGLREHMQTHLGPVKHYICPICGERFPSLLTLTEHKVTHSKSLDTGSCRICKLPLQSEEEFLEHCQMHPDLQNSLTGFRCVVCMQTVTSSVELKIHGTFHMQKTGAVPSNHPIACSAVTHLHIKKVFKCDACFKEFLTKQDLVKLDFNGLTYSLCALCVNAVSSVNRGKQLQQGAKTASGLATGWSHGENLSPDSVKIKTASSSSSSSSVSPFVAKTHCSSCSVKFESDGELKAHLQTVHRDQTPEGYPISRFSPLQSDERKTYQCIKCQMIFCSEWDIQVHVANHMLEEGLNHECKLCSQSFDSPAKLQCHLIEHGFEGMGGTFKCPVCFTVFVQGCKLQQHIFSAHGQEDKIYDCSQCPQKFFFQTELQNHSLSLHSNYTAESGS